LAYSDIIGRPSDNAGRLSSARPKSAKAVYEVVMRTSLDKNSEKNKSYRFKAKKQI
jgi:hypothetical protein